MGSLPFWNIFDQLQFEQLRLVDRKRIKKRRIRRARTSYAQSSLIQSVTNMVLLNKIRVRPKLQGHLRYQNMKLDHVYDLSTAKGSRI